MRVLGLVFLGVAFCRSIFVASYLEQLAWFNSLLNSSLLIRFLAIFAIGYGFYSLFYHLPIESWPRALAQLHNQYREPSFMFGFQAIRDAFFYYPCDKGSTSLGWDRFCHLAYRLFQHLWLDGLVSHDGATFVNGP
jgi:hypothetical protein